MRTWTRGSLRAAWRNMRRSRARSFLTMLGVIIGVASVISIVSIGQGVKEQVGKQIRHVGTDLITVRAGHVSLSGNSLRGLANNQITNTLSAKDPATVTQAARHAMVVPLSLISGRVTVGKTTYTGGPVVATTPDLPTILNQNLSYGSFFNQDDEGGTVAVVGQTAAIRMFGTSLPLGQTFDFRGQTFTVQAVFDNFNTVPLAADIDFNSAIYIPDTTGQQLTNNNATPYEILVKPDQSRQLDVTVSDIRRALARSHGDSEDFTVLKASDELAATNQTLNLLTELIAGVAAISLLVGGIGIMNITLVSVTERMHEIGIKKAVGATNRQILQEFMAEAVVLSVTGGLLGVVVAGVIDLILRILTSLQPVIEWQVVVLAAAVSIIIGIIFGTAPALQAARKDPITALRGE